jgi:hypothetical protein
LIPGKRVICNVEVPGTDMFDNRKTTVLRPSKLLHDQAKTIVENPDLGSNAIHLALWMLSRATNWRFTVRHLVKTGLFGGRNKIHASLRKLRTAGYVTIDRDGRDGGGIEAGIYLIASEPTWIDQELVGAVDNSEAANPQQERQNAGGNPETREPSFSAHRKDNSRVNPNTDTCADNVAKPVAPKLKADGRDDRDRKSHLTREAERRTGGAKARLPETEPGSRPAKGSAMKGLASGEAEQTPKDLYSKQLVDQMVAVASFPGSRMPNPRKAARSIASLIQWQVEGLDFHLDVLPAIGDVCSRVSDQAKPIVSWHYFTGAIRDAHARRTKPASPPRPVQHQLEGWTPAGAAFGRRR